MAVIQAPVGTVQQPPLPTQVPGITASITVPPPPTQIPAPSGTIIQPPA